MSDNKMTAVIDTAPVGDIRGALGAIRQHAMAARDGGYARFNSLQAISGRGHIVMVGDKDAGTFRPYGQTGQNDGSAPG
jgi:hypothetical protein